MGTNKRFNRLRRMHSVLIEVGMILSLVLVILAFRVNYRSEAALDLTAPAVQPLKLVPIIQTKIQQKPPPPPAPPIPVVVPNSEKMTYEPLNIDSEIHINEPAKVPPPPPPANASEGSNDIFVVVEDYPKPIGGMQGILNRVRYPEIARKAGIEGRVIVQFVIEKDGTVSHTKVLKGIGAGCDEAAVQAIKETRFTPGMQRKKPVRVKMAIPVVFKLKDK